MIRNPTTYAPRLEALPAFQSLAEALALWDGTNEADRRELRALFDRLAATPEFRAARTAIVGFPC